MNLVTQLIAILEENTLLYERMCKKAEVEAAAIQSGDFNALARIMKEREAITLDLKRADEGRHAIVEKIAHSIGRRGADITLAWLADIQADQSMKAKLLSVKGRLGAASDKAREMSDFNRRLIGRAVNTVRESIRFANVLVGQSDTYANGRPVAGKMPSGMMVAKAY